jgi:hypothetical protein
MRNNALLGFTSWNRLFNPTSFDIHNMDNVGAGFPLMSIKDC